MIYTFNEASTNVLQSRVRCHFDDTQWKVSMTKERTLEQDF